MGFLWLAIQVADFVQIYVTKIAVTELAISGTKNKSP
jgi:hypothetical protein